MHNILVDLHRIKCNKYNGLYHFCYQLGHYLAAIPTTDMQLSFYMPQEMNGFFGNTVKYAFQKSRDKYFFLGAGKFSVWHIATTLSWYRPFNNRVKNIYTIHDLNFLNEEEFTTASKKKYLRLIQQRVNRADHLTYISNFARQQAMENLNVGDTPYSIIYNGCNRPLQTNFNAPGYKPAAPFLFSIGQMHSRKNFHVLPALLVNNDYELIIAGLKDFPYTKKVMQEAERLGVAARIKLAGPVSEEEKNWYYSHCVAFVFPSVGEGFGMPVLEAMHFGKPVFLSNATSLPEVGGNAAYYFTDFDPEAMRIVFENGMNDFNNNNRLPAIQQQAAAFNWNKTAKEYLDVYRQQVLNK